jgi:hypothetical protein
MAPTFELAPEDRVHLAPALASLHKHHGSGSGTNAPLGVLTALAAPGNALRVLTATTAVTAIADVYSFKPR